MKYNSKNKPLICMQTQSTCYKGTEKMKPLGVLWHSTGANNPDLKRYLQPSKSKPKADTYSRTKWLEILGKNTNGNDWNNIYIEAGLNAWIGKLASGEVTSVQTMPWDYKPWGCGGACNNGWIQFEICEDNLKDKTYFNKVYKEACELTAYLCQLYNINPKGYVTFNGKKVPTILCHKDSYDLGLGSGHVDITHWFPKYGKSMATVRNDVAALLKNAGETITPKPNENEPIEVKTYKVVTEINKYSTADDAKNKKAAKGTYNKGTYYIYNKYPNGYNGVFNITTDKTGEEPGGWINPAENKQTVIENVEKLYRVRKTKDDVKTQKGAYKNLEGAIECCQKAGIGYHVFDWNWKIVYSYKESTIETPKEEKPTESPKTETVIAVYDLDYPEKNLIIDKKINRASIDCVKAIKTILLNNKDFDISIAKAFFNLAPIYNIDPLMAIAQSILETGWFKFIGSSINSEQHNYCGLGATASGANGASFKTIEEGVNAQLQHLFAYGCKDSLPKNVENVDPRFSLVTRGIATYWQQLAGRWACPGYDSKVYDTPQKAMEAGNTYGQLIRVLYNQLISTTVSEEEVEKYFSKDEPQPEEAIDKPSMPDNIENQPEADDTSTIKLILDYFKKLIQLLNKLFNKGE